MSITSAPKVQAPQRPVHRWIARGQAMVEFALVLPLLMACVFGIIEYALINYSVGSADFAARDAARLGSILGRSASDADQQMIADIKAHMSGFVPVTIQSITIFKSNESGSLNTAMSDAYDGSGALVGTVNWGPDARNDSLVDADYLGVQIVYKYQFITAFLSGLGSGLQFTAVSVQRIEPLEYSGYTPSHAALARANLPTGPAYSLPAGTSPPVAPLANESNSGRIQESSRGAA